MLEADEWPRVLANVEGTIVGRTERVSSNRLMDLLGAPSFSLCSKAPRNPRMQISPFGNFAVIFAA
jgi:hypothetical protein